MDWITQQIAICIFLDAQTLADEVDTVLCLREDCGGDRTDVEAVCIPLLDGGGSDCAGIQEAFAFLGEVVAGGGRTIAGAPNPSRSRRDP